MGWAERFDYDGDDPGPYTWRGHGSQNIRSGDRGTDTWGFDPRVRDLEYRPTGDIRKREIRLNYTNPADRGNGHQRSGVLPIRDPLSKGD